MKNTCKIIEDLLPLYVDDACSAESREFVSEHLRACECCRMLLNEMRAMETEAQTAPKLTALKSVNGRLAKLRKSWKLRGIAIGLGVCALLIAAFCLLTQLQVVNVSTDVIRITNVCQLSNGDIAFHLYIDDEYDLNLVACEVNSAGEMYIQPRRAVIEGKRPADFDLGLFNSNYCVDITPADPSKSDDSDACAAFSFSWNDEPAAIYVGTEDDRILIWEKGMELPAAGADMEKEFQPNLYGNG